MSSNLNPVEHACDILQRHVNKWNPSPQSPALLERALIEEWGNITLVQIGRLLRSFNSHIITNIECRTKSPRTKHPLLVFVYVDKIPPMNFTTRT